MRSMKGTCIAPNLWKNYACDAHDEGRLNNAESLVNLRWHCVGQGALEQHEKQEFRQENWRSNKEAKDSRQGRSSPKVYSKQIFQKSLASFKWQNVDCRKGDRIARIRFHRYSNDGEPKGVDHLHKHPTRLLCQDCKGVLLRNEPKGLPERHAMMVQGREVRANVDDINRHFRTGLPDDPILEEGMKKKLT
ncbi:hypothetical protein Q3G72_024802 [Acer saccharum]|nr:hypothetical protein Q3G72_024802 [Acer saccharum]